MCMCYSNGMFSLCVLCVFSSQEEEEKDVAESKAVAKKAGWQWWRQVARKSTGHRRWRW